MSLHLLQDRRRSAASGEVQHPVSLFQQERNTGEGGIKEAHAPLTHQGGTGQGNQHDEAEAASVTTAGVDQHREDEDVHQYAGSEEMGR